MEEQVQWGDFTSLGLDHMTTMDLRDDYNNVARNAQKRPWPFATAADDQLLSLDRRPSTIVCQPAAGPLYLLGSVSCAIPVRTF